MIQQNPTKEEYEQKYKEWMEEKLEILERSDVEFVHVVLYEREYEEFQAGGETFVEEKMVKILTNTVHVEDLRRPIVAEIVQGGEVRTHQNNSYAYVIDEDLDDLTQWLELDTHRVSDDYNGSTKYDYPAEFVAQYI